MDLVAFYSERSTRRWRNASLRSIPRSLKSVAREFVLLACIEALSRRRSKPPGGRAAVCAAAFRAARVRAFLSHRRPRSGAASVTSRPTSISIPSARCLPASMWRRSCIGSATARPGTATAGAFSTGASSDVMTIERAKAEFAKVARTAPSPWRILASLRYPERGAQKR